LNDPRRILGHILGKNFRAKKKVNISYIIYVGILVSAGFTPWAASARAHGSPQEKRPPQRDKRQKKMYATESENFYFSTFIWYLVTTFFWPNRYTYFSQAPIQRGGARAFRPSREKSAYTTGVYFGTVFRPNTPNFRDAPLPKKKSINPCLTSLQFTALVYYYYKCPHSLLYVLRYVGRKGLHINCAHGPPQR